MSLQEIIAIGSLLAATGCSPVRQTDYSDIDLVDVTGRVTLDGQPLPNATVAFESLDITASTGRTNADGEYRLMFNSEKSGCTTGEKVVRVSMSAGEEEDPDAPRDDLIKIPARYNHQSELTATVSSSFTEFDFDLETSE